MITKIQRQDNKTIFLCITQDREQDEADEISLLFWKTGYLARCRLPEQKEKGCSKMVVSHITDVMCSILLLHNWLASQKQVSSIFCLALLFSYRILSFLQKSYQGNFRDQEVWLFLKRSLFLEDSKMTA